MGDSGAVTGLTRRCCAALAMQGWQELPLSLRLSLPLSLPLSLLLIGAQDGVGRCRAAAGNVFVRQLLPASGSFSTQPVMLDAGVLCPYRITKS